MNKDHESGHFVNFIVDKELVLAPFFVLLIHIKVWIAFHPRRPSELDAIVRNIVDALSIATFLIIMCISVTEIVDCLSVPRWHTLVRHVLRHLIQMWILRLRAMDILKDVEEDFVAVLVGVMPVEVVNSPKAL